MNTRVLAFKLVNELLKVTILYPTKKRYFEGALIVWTNWKELLYKNYKA